MYPGHLAVQAESWKEVEAAITTAVRVIKSGLGFFNDSDKHTISCLYVMWHFTEGRVGGSTFYKELDFKQSKHYVPGSVDIKMNQMPSLLRFMRKTY